MGVWRRLTNVARGKVRQWQREREDSMSELVNSELERHPSPTEERRAKPPEPSVSEAPPPAVVRAAGDTVPRSDLLDGANGSDEPSRESSSIPKRRL